MIKKTIFKISFYFIWVLLLSPFTSYSNQDFQSKYLYGKDLYKSAKYGPAMEVLLPLTKDAPGNKFVEYSHYYYSLAALKGGRLEEAYQMLLQLIQKYAQWEDIEEAYYLAANVAFEQKKYRYGLNFLKNIGPKLKEDADALKENYIIKLFPIDSLKALQKSYPGDEAIGSVLLKRLSVIPLNEKDKMLANYLSQEFKINETSPTISIKSTVKNEYNFAILFPFMLNEIANENSIRSSTYALEMYQGIQKAADTIKSKIKINLYAYDTEKEVNKVNEILKLPELKGMDFIIGPLISSQNNAVVDFASSNGIININPLSSNSRLTENNNFVFLFQPSLEMQASQVARFVEVNFPAIEKKAVYIFYSDNARDSILAANYKDSVLKKNYTVALYEQLSKDKLSKISLSLSDSAAVSLVNHIFIASSDQMVAANAVSSLEKTQIITPVFTRSEWLQLPLLSYEQLQKRQIHFIYPDYIDLDNPIVQGSKSYYLNKMNTFPTSYYYTGYEIMNLFGKNIQQFGTYFLEGLKKQGFIKGVFFSGYDYSISRDNSFVPIVKFEENKLRVLNLPTR